MNRLQGKIKNTKYMSNIETAIKREIISWRFVFHQPVVSGKAVLDEISRDHLSLLERAFLIRLRKKRSQEGKLRRAVKTSKGSQCSREWISFLNLLCGVPPRSPVTAPKMTA